MIKFKLLFDKDKETLWLNEMSKKGYALTKFFSGFYTFEKCDPGKYIYQVDFGNRFFAVNNDYREFMEENGIEIMPMYVIADRKEFRDGIDIDGKGVFEYVEKTGRIPKTSAVSPNEYAEYFSALTSGGAEVIHFSFCSLLSSTHRNAVIAANQLDGVHVIDTKNLGGGIGLLALKSCSMRDNGISAEVICAEAEKLIPKTRVSYLLESVEFLRLGGRCSAVSALGANLFSIRPCAGMVDGRTATKEEIGLLMTKTERSEQVE